MIRETMTAQERLQAAIQLDEGVDRHPIFPLVVTAAPRLYGVTQAEAWRNHDAAREALLKCYQDFGYDFGAKSNYYYPQLPGRHIAAPVRNLIPGRNLGEDDLYQVDERVLFQREDYDRIAALGWNAFWDEHYPVMSGKPVERLARMQDLANQAIAYDNKICEEKGMRLFLGAAVDSVVMAFSQCRTLTEFTMDLYYVPDKVEAAMKASWEDIITNGIKVCKQFDKKFCFIVLERGSGFYYRLPIFERFEWPYLQRYVDALISEGITPWLHLDTDWSINLPYFAKLPPRKCVVDLDSTTDIFRAKEILKGHTCISSDVSASLLSVGSPEEVTAYCRKLIDEVGEGGGLILSTGCECPINVKPENLRAMVETGKTYRGRKAARAAVKPAGAGKQARAAALPKGLIAGALSRLEYNEVETLVKDAIGKGVDPLEILEECKAGMEMVGELYGTGEYFLSELIISADIFKKVAATLSPLIASRRGEVPSLGAMVIGTPKGDIHDIGKNIAVTLFQAAGFEVHDLGVDVPPERFVEEAVRTGARIVGFSTLITTTFDPMRQAVDLMKKEGLRDDRFVIIGGGVTTDTARAYVGADAYTLNCAEGLKLCKQFIQDRKA